VVRLDDARLRALLRAGLTIASAPCAKSIRQFRSARTAGERSRHWSLVRFLWRRDPNAAVSIGRDRLAGFDAK